MAHDTTTLFKRTSPEKFHKSISEKFHCIGRYEIRLCGNSEMRLHVLADMEVSCTVWRLLAQLAAISAELVPRLGYSNVGNTGC